MTFNVFFYCYKEQMAIEKSLDSLFSIYPQVSVYLVSYGGYDFSYLEDKHRTLCFHMRPDLRSEISTLTPENFLQEQKQKIMLNSFWGLSEDITKGMLFGQSEFTLIMEPDVLIRGEIKIPSETELLGSLVNEKLWKGNEINKVLEKYKGISVEKYGAVPAIINNKKWMVSYAKIRENPCFVEELCRVSPHVVHTDILIPLVMSLSGTKEVLNNEITECFRDPSWEINGKPIVHQYRKYYQ